VVAGSPATVIGADRRPGVLARVDKLEREGMRSVAETSHDSGYPVELRGDMARFETFRARWLGNDPASYATIYRMLANSDLDQALPAIACPVLIVGGRYDGTRPPATVEPLVKVIPGARYTLIDSGHYMAAQTPELVAKTIGDFLDAMHG
jgi:3-oxoadipate enol-lactonase